MDIRTLQYFLTVAKEGSITGAARVLHMTQPPLTRQIQDLEHELGTPLFIRGNRRITLTEEGMLLCRRAEEMLELMEKTKAELASPKEDISGEIRIGAGETDAISILANTAKSLSLQYPGIRYRIYSGDADIVTEKLDKGLIDFGLLVEPVDITKYHSVRLPVRDTWGVLMRKDSALAKKPCIQAKDLYGQPLILSCQMSESRELSAWFGTDAARLHITLRYNLIYNAAHFVRQGFGYAIALDKLIPASDNSDLCFRPLSPSMEAGLCVVWKKSQLLSKASWLFLTKLKESI